jgi:hypothetical protein
VVHERRRRENNWKTMKTRRREKNQLEKLCKRVSCEINKVVVQKQRWQKLNHHQIHKATTSRSQVKV